MTDSEYHSVSRDNWKYDYSTYMELITEKLDENLDAQIEYHDQICIEVKGSNDTYFIEMNYVEPHPHPINQPVLRYSNRNVVLTFEDSRGLEPTEITNNSVDKHVTDILDMVRELEETPLKDAIDRELESGSTG